MATPGLTALDRRLLVRLTRHGIVPDSRVEEIESEAIRRGQTLARVVVQLGLADEKAVARHLARVNGSEFLDLDTFEPDPIVLRHLRRSVVHRTRAVPVGIVGDSLVVAMADLSNVLIVDDLKALAGRPIQTVLATESAIQSAIDKYYLYEPDERPTGENVPRLASSDSIPTAGAAAPTLSGQATVSSDAETQHNAPVPARTPAPGSTIFAESETRIDESGSERGAEDDAAPNTLSSDTQITSLRSRVVQVGELSTVFERDLAEAQTLAERAERFQRESGDASSAAIERPATEESGAEGITDTAVDKILREMIDSALGGRAEELEFAPPSSRRNRTRIRRDGLWVDSVPYPVKYHESLILRLRQLAAVPAGNTQPVEAHFVLAGKRGDIPVVACFTPTVRGERCVLRFPANIPLIQRPLRVLGASGKQIKDFDHRLSGSGGGVLLVTSDHSRLTGQLYSSILFEQAGEGRSVLSINLSPDRALPNVHQITCPDEAAVRAALGVALSEQPDLLGVSSIPSGAMLADVFAHAIKGRSVVACLTVVDSATAHAAMKAAGVDAMMITLGLIAHVHATRVPRLCPQCRERLDRAPRRLPDWAAEIEGDGFWEANGCSSCGGTGRKGTSWVPELFVPDPGTGPRPVALRTREESLRLLVKEGALDLRDVR